MMENKNLSQKLLSVGKFVLHLMLGQMVGKSKTEINTLFINADKLEL